MTRFIARRLMQGVVLLCLVATIVFLLGRLTGNPVDLMLPEGSPPEDRIAMIRSLGLDGPWYRQFLIFIGNALHGDLGTSIRMREPAVVRTPLVQNRSLMPSGRPSSGAPSPFCSRASEARAIARASSGVSFT